MQPKIEKTPIAPVGVFLFGDFQKFLSVFLKKAQVGLWKLSDGFSHFLLTAYIRFPLQSPTEYINQPKLLVVITNIHVKKTARRMRGNTGRYAEGGNIIIRIDGRSTALLSSGLSTARLCQYRAQGTMSTPRPKSL